MLNLRQKQLNNIILIGDRVLIKPSTPHQKTESGLLLPQGLHKKEELFFGYIIKVGPGYPIPSINEVDEPWKEVKKEVKYVPIQPKPGDLAVYLQKSTFEIMWKKSKYVIVPNSALLMLVREDD